MSYALKHSSYRGYGDAAAAANPSASSVPAAIPGIPWPIPGLPTTFPTSLPSNLPAIPGVTVVVGPTPGTTQPTEAQPQKTPPVPPQSVITWTEFVGGAVGVVVGAATLYFMFHKAGGSKGRRR